MRKNIFRIFISFLVLFSCFNLYGLDIAQITYEGKQAPDFSLQDLSGKNVSLSDFKGKAVILFFWATWCPHCRRAIPTLNTEYKNMKENNIELLAIDVGEEKSILERYIKDRPMSYLILLDTDTKIANKYGIIGIPTFILISKENKVVSVSNVFPGNYRDLLSK